MYESLKILLDWIRMFCQIILQESFFQWKKTGNSMKTIASKIKTRFLQIYHHTQLDLNVVCSWICWIWLLQHNLLLLGASIPTEFCWWYHRWRTSLLWLQSNCFFIVGHMAYRWCPDCAIFPGFHSHILWDSNRSQIGPFYRCIVNLSFLFRVKIFALYV